MTLSPNSLKAILFDLDGTLRHHIPNGSDDFNRYAMSLGIALHEEDITRAARWEHYYFANSPEIQADSAAHKSEDQFWTNFGRRRLIVLGSSPKQAEELAPQFRAHMHENHKPIVHMPEEVRPLLVSLKQAGFILGVVSNREQRYEQQIEELGLTEFFQFTLAGGEVNSFKPQRGIFEEALRRAGTSAPETLYVGDNYFADVVGSRRAGLLPVLYDPSGLFPDAECPVIQTFDQLPKLLK